VQANGNAKPSVASTLIDRLPHSPDREEAERIARDVTGVAYVGKQSVCLHSRS
jgi:hypothetical protein